MPGTITIHLTDEECQALARLSRETDLPQERVLIQGLRLYEMSHEGLVVVRDMGPTKAQALQAGCGRDEASHA